MFTRSVRMIAAWVPGDNRGECAMELGREARVFSATVRWPFDGAQDERTGGLGVVRRAY